ncbi:hypothetical protein KOW79_007780 [Hemibagrus wyckioides]|uniref:Uncharacterized protein n=1 Tax=Hemibagrus wyckioides TaxID=337641 RepID=A0A9D3NUG6_9TELE|nr:hypothetical protein KOW79_007780 [Hemibagrus wyckioides]
MTTAAVPIIDLEIPLLDRQRPSLDYISGAFFFLCGLQEKSLIRSAKHKVQPRPEGHGSILHLLAGGASGSKVLPCSPRPPPLHGSQISDYPITAVSDTLADEPRAFGADGGKSCGFWAAGVE